MEILGNMFKIPKLETTALLKACLKKKKLSLSLNYCDCQSFTNNLIPFLEHRIGFFPDSFKLGPAM